MKSDAPPQNVAVESSSRLQTLYSYHILDTPPEPVFDSLVQLASRLCDTPMAAISLLDDRRQWFKASVGLSVRETDVSISFCRHALTEHDLFVVEDAHANPTFARNPLVTGELQVRFYAGYPLETADGDVLGMLLVLDRVPRRLTDQQRADLKALAHQVMVALDKHRLQVTALVNLRSMAHQYAALVQRVEEGSRVGFWRWQGNRFMATSGTLRWLGVASADDTSLESLLAALPTGTEQERWNAALLACEQQGTPMDVECPWQAGASALVTRWVAVRGDPIDDQVDFVRGAVLDVTERHSMQQTAHRREARYQTVAELLCGALWDWDLRNGTVWFGDSMQTLLGYLPTDHFPADTVSSFVQAEDLPGVRQSLQQTLDSDSEQWRCCARVMRADGAFRWMDVQARIFRDANGQPVRLVGALTDVTDRAQAKQAQNRELARLRQQVTLLDQAKEALIVKDKLHRIEFWNAGAERLYGWKAEEVLGHHAPTILREDPQLVGQREARLREAGDFQRDVVHYHKDGRRLDVRGHWTVVTDEHGQWQSVLGIFSDISQSRRDRERIHHLAFYDQLTRLPNRTLLVDRLQQALATSGRHRQHGAVMLLDLDNFKRLNDTLGHAKGDELLQQAAQRLQRCLRAVDTVARLGGDEFVVLLTELGRDIREAAQQAESVAMKILVELAKPFPLENYTYICTASIGVTLFDGKAGMQGLLKQADIAMYEVKQSGRNAVRFFDPQMQHLVEERARLENELRHAALNHEFEVHYQPVRGSDGALAGMEALMRWRHPERGLLAAAEFISVAEEIGVVAQLGTWLLGQTFRQAAAWQQQGHTVRVAVNVSASQLQDDQIVTDVRSALMSSNASPSLICLELTESMVSKDAETAMRVLTALRAMGIRIGLDDFGTGYSSLSMLERLPLDDLKIDQSFVRRLHLGERDRKVVQSIVSLGKSLELNIIAEGIETEEQQALLQEFGCHEFQGFLHGRAMPANIASSLLQ